VRKLARRFIPAILALGLLGGTAAAPIVATAPPAAASTTTILPSLYYRG
jgi:hypothetical protein